MKVRFYCDVPEYRMQNFNLFANTAPATYSVCKGSKRVAFDVDLPPEVWKEMDAQSPRVAAEIVEEHQEQEA